MINDLDNILKAFSKLKNDLNIRDYDDSIFLQNLPEKEPISLVIPFERSSQGYIDIFKSYIGADVNPDLSDEQLLTQYLSGKVNTPDLLLAENYNPIYIKGFVEQMESLGGGGNRANQEFNDYIRNKHSKYKSFSEKELQSFPDKYKLFNEFKHIYRPKTILSESEQDNLVAELSKVGFKACTKDSSNAKDTSFFVVNPNGIQSPFMTKASIQKTLPKLKDIIANNNINVGGHIAPICFSQLRYINNDSNDLETKNIIENFVKKTLEKEAINPLSINDLTNSNKLISAGKIGDDSNLQEIYDENEKTGRSKVWRGGVLGNNAFVANIDNDTQDPHKLRKSFAMATSDINYAMNYSCSGGMFSEYSDSSFACGFLYQYQATKEEVYFPDRGIEKAPTISILKHKGQTIETPIFPWKQKLDKTYLFIIDKTSRKRFLYPLDKNNIEHKELMDIQAPIDTRINGYMKDRISAQFAEAKINDGKPIAHNINLIDINNRIEKAKIIFKQYINVSETENNKLPALEKSTHKKTPTPIIKSNEIINKLKNKLHNR